MNKLLVVVDANVLIELCELNLTSKLSSLNYKFCVIDIAWSELLETQQLIYRKIIGEKLKIVELNEEQMAEVMNFRVKNPKLSLFDCASVVFASHNGIALWASDINLLAVAKQCNVRIIDCYTL